MAIICYEKKYGETLAVMLDRFKSEYPEHQEQKITYAGRLDPMASGLVILLTGDDVHRKEEFLKQNKVYEVEFILGVETDTYDILGRMLSQDSHSETITQKFLDDFTGLFKQPYPAFSSKTVEGKPLFQWFREGLIDTIEIPTNMVEITRIELLEDRTISIDDFKSALMKVIQGVLGDFRQEAILQDWQGYFSNLNQLHVNIHKIRVEASSGTYMRSLVHRIGQQVGSGAVSVHIKRVSIGDFSLDSKI